MTRVSERSGEAFCSIANLYGWKPDTIFQVGIGCRHPETKVFEKHWPNIEIVGFEPHPEIVKGLKGTYPGGIFPIAISDHVGKEILHTKNTHKDGSSLFQHFVELESDGYHEIEVECYTLDYFGELYLTRNHIVLWLDCEGAELKAINGGTEFLKHVDFINVEMTAKPRKAGWADPYSVHCALHDSGFARTWVHSMRSCIGQYDAIYVKRELLNPAFCCCPCELWKDE